MDMPVASGQAPSRSVRKEMPSLVLPATSFGKVTWKIAMKTITCLNDLREFGIDALTGEACGLGYRVLCDIDKQGKRILERCFGLKDLGAQPSWNSGSKERPHVGSVLLFYEMLAPVSVFALLDMGCIEVWLLKGGTVMCVEKDDPPDQTGAYRTIYKEQLNGVFAPRGTAGDRNVHMMSGRVE